MNRRAPVLLLALAACSGQPAGAPNEEVARWEKQARAVTIVRDDWGIPHITGKTDADAVFGLMYAQAEDDFNRVETNYLLSLGRLAEAEGEKEIWRDLRMKLFIDPGTLKARYAEAPEWLRKLMDAWADGLNFYLHRNPATKPRVITRFEPWMALSFSEGSIGGDIERISLAELERFYGGNPAAMASLTATGTPVAPARLASDAMRPRLGSRIRSDDPLAEPSGSNGIAIAPANTKAGRALLLINPHTSFFFRSEVQVTSEEGLNAYGAVTWGQFFVYQGFNEKAGWMHTSSNVDNIDEYRESVTRKGDTLVYRHGTGQKPVIVRTVTIPFRTDTGMARRTFTVYRTEHGPVVRSIDGKWVSVSLMEEPLKALTQSYSRTKSPNLRGFHETMELHTNSSNNTVFADADGNIAYFHANFVPKRNPKLDWSNPVDGADPAADWQGVHSIDESPNVFNPPNGWVYNTNNWPYTAAGPNSPKRADYPAYMETGIENPRGIHAIRVLEGRKDFTIESLIAAAYDTWLPAFEELIPALVAAWEKTPASNPLKAKTAEQIAMLKGWDRRWSVESIPTALAIYWGDELWLRASAGEWAEDLTIYQYMATRMPASAMLEAMAKASDKLTADFGTWKTPWGEINRFQRLTGDIAHPFDDAKPSIPVGFASARWGSLAAFGARSFNGSKKIYGTNGNSFVAVVEFGDSVRARAVTAGGASGHPESKHFSDQALRYSTGDLREVYFYPGQLKGHTERTYHPGS